MSVMFTFWPSRSCLARLPAAGRLVIAAPGGHRDTLYLARLCRDQRDHVCHFRALPARRPAPGLRPCFSACRSSCSCSLPEVGLSL